MNNLIYEYEHACESRNYMGIQLIDRNDELCILYEKSNIQENILKPVQDSKDASRFLLPRAGAHSGTAAPLRCS